MQRNDLSYYDQWAPQWWQETATAAPLSQLNPLRFQFFDAYISEWPGGMHIEEAQRTRRMLLDQANDDAAFEAAGKINKKDAYQSYIDAFPQGAHITEALKRVDEIMHQADALPLVAIETPVIAAISELSAKGHGIVGVTEGENLKGVITDGDVRRYLEQNAASTMQGALQDTTAGAIMTEGSVTLLPDMIVGEALSILQNRRISAAFVTTDGKPIGLITMLRLLNRGAA